LSDQIDGCDVMNNYFMKLAIEVVVVGVNFMMLSGLLLSLHFHFLQVITAIKLPLTLKFSSFW